MAGTPVVSAPTLRQMLMGAPLTERGAPSERHAALAAALDAELRFVVALLGEVYGDSDAAAHAILEVGNLAQMPATADGICCRRAALLFAMREPELCARLEAREAGGPDAGFARDVHERILPLYGPRFLRNSCQAPDSFVAGVAVLAELWSTEKVGNWPLHSEGIGPATEAELAEEA